jgi:hypothetical protein
VYDLFMSKVRDGFEHFLLSIMGPAAVGDPSAPARDLPPRPVDVCPGCGQDRDLHEVVREPGLTYTRCPGQGSPEGQG